LISTKIFDEKIKMLAHSENIKFAKTYLLPYIFSATLGQKYSNIVGEIN
jgi:hypothetical protein